MTTPPSSLILLCIGDLVEDIVIWPHGRTVVGTDNPATIVRARGGSAANVAVFAAPFVRSRFLGRVGDDSMGRALVDELTTAGVQPLVQHEGRTGAIVVHIEPDGERTMYPDRAAAGELADVNPEWVEGTGILHISGYSLAREASAAAVLTLAATARAGGARISLDAASVDLLTSLGSDHFTALIDALRPDYYFANADEARVFPVGRVVQGGAVCVVKNGADPVAVHEPGEPVRLITVPAVADVRDTTGAGDAFAAGFLSAVLQDESLDDAVRRGTDLAAGVLANPGATMNPLLQPQT